MLTSLQTGRYAPTQCAESSAQCLGITQIPQITSREQSTAVTWLCRGSAQKPLEAKCWPFHLPFEAERAHWVQHELLLARQAG